ncbi:MAG: alpha/beta hydrolase [Flavobacteriaceae bacterium]|nr:alpha/beta hydrolase [Flavobacteriaceae bacterium]|tara:strand:- start:82974 stop:83909 length:936 start_codon:yes stop_codon:yes gene_type:complete
MSRTKKVLLFVILLLAIGIYNGVYQDISLEELKTDYTNEHSKFIDVDGFLVHYREEGKGFPIVLIHGTASSLHTWDDWTRELTSKYRVIRMDLPAFGLTGPNKTGDYTIQSYVHFLNRFVQEVKLDSFHLAGSSLGGNIAWNFTANHPDKVEKLILVDASGLPTGKPQPSVFKMAKTPILSDLLLHLTPRFFIEKNMKEVYADESKITDELITRYHKMALREGNRQAFVDRARIDFTANEYQSVEKLKGIKHTTLLIWGAQDAWIPLANGNKMDSLLPNSKLEVLENSGHVPMEENPKESLKLLIDFLEAF